MPDTNEHPVIRELHDALAAQVEAVVAEVAAPASSSEPIDPQLSPGEHAGLTMIQHAEDNAAYIEQRAKALLQSAQAKHDKMLEYAHAIREAGKQVAELNNAADKRIEAAGSAIEAMWAEFVNAGGVPPQQQNGGGAG